MNGNLMDTTCTSITSETMVNVYQMQISDLTGIQYFDGLNDLNCNNNLLQSLPNLPANLQYLDCGINQLTSIPSLPANILIFWCPSNQLTSLPNLPATIWNFDCGYNQLTSLPSLPANLLRLYCRYNPLTSLPSLPTNLQNLYCNNNQLTSLTSLPSLPSNLSKLDCHNNNIACFPIFPISLSNPAYFSIAGNSFTCLPNYVAAMNSSYLAYPLCANGDTVNNPSNCPSAEGIVGYTFTDANSNCIKDNGEQGVNNILLKQYDINSNLLAQTYSFSNGIYNFADSIGTYTIAIDTIGKPYTLLCTYPGIDSTVTLSIPNPLISDVNFDIACKPGFDVGVQSAIRYGWVFPGLQHHVNILAGDMSNWYNLNCAAGVSGIIQVTVTGSVTYNGVAPNALTPNVAGNVFTYTIADFGNVNFQSNFGLLFTTDTTAQGGDTICVSVTVTPSLGDNNPNNNTYQYCYHVLN
jgi:hypothetical protein